ncbi:MAG: hypothetical protein ABIG84_08225 [archaeon]
MRHFEETTWGVKWIDNPETHTVVVNRSFGNYGKLKKRADAYLQELGYEETDAKDGKTYFKDTGGNLAWLVYNDTTSLKREAAYIGLSAVPWIPTMLYREEIEDAITGFAHGVARDVMDAAIESGIRSRELYEILGMAADNSPLALYVPLGAATVYAVYHAIRKGAFKIDFSSLEDSIWPDVEKGDIVFNQNQGKTPQGVTAVVHMPEKGRGAQGKVKSGLVDAMKIRLL